MNALDLARRFFALPDAEKHRVHIRHSPHHRGYSVMKNERDWREQIHFGLERAPGASPLTGPNQWPEALGEPWRRALIEFLDEAGQRGLAMLRELGLPVPERGAEPYLLLKMICYHPQPNAANPRPGVAAHCDWSWITLLHQDAVGGLEEQDAEGVWRPVDAPCSVTVGELAEIATGGRLRATPHRVVNRSAERPRLSVPVFLCPPLDATVLGTRHCFHEPHGHAHRVRNPAEPCPDFVFGESEWRRKGLGRWCWRSACLDG